MCTSLTSAGLGLLRGCTTCSVLIGMFICKQSTCDMFYHVILLE